MAQSRILAYTLFGLWNQVLTVPAPGAKYTYMSLIMNYTRGIAFCRKGNIKDAREELEYYRQNGWSLMGLYQSLLGQGKKDEAEKIKQQFDQAWSKSDIKINSSVL